MAKATKVVPDSRAVHYWDGDQAVGKTFEPILNTPDAAWDVWMLFAPGLRWEAKAPPEPTWWEHQLWGMPSELHLDAARFAAKARKLEASGKH